MKRRDWIVFWVIILITVVSMGLFCSSTNNLLYRLLFVIVASVASSFAIKFFILRHKTEEELFGKEGNGC